MNGNEQIICSLNRVNDLYFNAKMQEVIEQYCLQLKVIWRQDDYWRNQCRPVKKKARKLLFLGREVLLFGNFLYRSDEMKITKYPQIVYAVLRPQTDQLLGNIRPDNEKGDIY